MALTTMTSIQKAIACALAFILCQANMTSASASEVTRAKYILSVDLPKEILCAEGNVPSLPYRVVTHYSDGSREYRHIRWNNSSKELQEAHANPSLTPAGSEYTVKGYIIGDNSTAYGYPVEVKIRVGKTVSQTFSKDTQSSAKASQATSKAANTASNTSANKPIAEPLPLGQVSITSGNRLASNRDLAIAEILKWDVKQQLYNYRDSYGLSTEGYPKSNGWDSPTTKLKGHGTGHYMSALAFAYSASQNDSIRAEILSRVKTLINSLRECQERTFVYDEKLGRYREARDYAPEEQLREMKGTWEAFDEYKKDYANYGYGYLNAIPAAHLALIEMYRPYNNTDWVWAPYYTVHKQLAGLIDIATQINDEEIANKAFTIAKDMGLWVWNRLHYRTHINKEGSREQRRATPGNRYEMWNMYIAGEVGGMQESLSRLSEMSSKIEDKQRLAEAASYFDSPAFYDPLSKNIDDIRTRHANQHIPMITGAIRQYRNNGNAYYYRIAENFWKYVQAAYIYAPGGVGNGEMFRQPYSQMAAMAASAPEINETCCAYNLAKLTKELNCFNPDEAAYMDYYERVLYNQIVGSLHPEHYMTTYQYSVGLNASKPWGNRTPQSSCCGGTGSENHVKYQEAAYFVSDDCIWVALYLPTKARWEVKGVTLEQDCQWPAEQSRIRILEAKGKFSIKLRVPYWATNGFEIKLNNKIIAKDCVPGSYFELTKRSWKKGDVIEINMPFSKHIHYGPDKLEISGKEYWMGAVMYGPLVMGTHGIQSWEEARLNLSSELDEIEIGETQTHNTTTVHNLSIGNKKFIPDFHLDHKATRYFAIAMSGNQNPHIKASQTSTDNTQLEELRLIAKHRMSEEEAWAPYGMQRLKSAFASASSSELSGILNSMRPAHLAELEDLIKLQEMMQQLPAADKRNEQQRKAVEYAEMVIAYVRDGSGTRDMIAKAEQEIINPYGLLKP